MTMEEAVERIEDHMQVHKIGEYPHLKLKKAFDMAIEALRARSRDNTPLTLEELRKMKKGEPVWVVHKGAGERYGVINYIGEHCMFAYGINDPLYTYADRFETPWETYEEDWLAYRRKPEDGTENKMEVEQYEKV